MSKRSEKEEQNRYRCDVATTAIESNPDYEAIDLESGIIDLMTNLMHLAESEGLNPESIIRMVSGHWEAER